MEHASASQRFQSETLKKKIETCIFGKTLIATSGKNKTNIFFRHSLNLGITERILLAEIKLNQICVFRSPRKKEIEENQYQKA